MIVPTLRRMRPALGTFVELGIFAPDAGALSAVSQAFAELHRVERLMSFHDAGSELSRLNAHPRQRVPLSATTLRALRIARALTVASGGLFNCTVGGWLVKRGRLPDHGGERALPAGDESDIEIGSSWALLRRPVRITLDGIAKGLAVDRALARCRANGVRNAWMNAGGDLRVVGRHALVVRLRGQAQTFALSNGALATSAAHSGARSHWPADLIGASGTAAPGQWSVLAATAWQADGLTKVAALASPSERERLLESLGGHLVAALEPRADPRAA